MEMREVKVVPALTVTEAAVWARPGTGIPNPRNARLQATANVLNDLRFMKGCLV